MKIQQRMCGAQTPKPGRTELFRSQLNLKNIMSYLASIHHFTTGHFLLDCYVKAHDLHEAENAAISKAALAMRGNPREMDVRRLHQCAQHAVENATDAPHSNA